MEKTSKTHAVVDVDAHYYENPRSFAKYLDEPWKRRIAGWSGRFYTTPAANIQTADNHSQGRIRRQRSSVSFGGADPATVDNRAEVLASMAYLGVDVVVLVPGTMLAIGEVTDAARAVALCHGYIEAMLEEVADPARGIYVPIVAPNQNPTEAAELIDRHAGADGVCGVVMMTDGPVLPLGDPYYDPIYDACVRNELPLLLHSGFGGPEGRESGFGLQTLPENHVAFILNNEIQLTSIVMQGVPERFPRLRIVFQEAGILWIPTMMYRLDMEYSMHRSYMPLLKKPPSAYIKDFFFGTQPLERLPKPEHMQAVMDIIDGSHTLMFATDWPHSDFDSPVVVERLHFLGEEGICNILAGNALRALRFRHCPLAGGDAVRKANVVG